MADPVQSGKTGRCHFSVANFSFKQGTGIVLIFLALLSAGLPATQQESLYALEAELREVQAQLREYVESTESKTRDSADLEARLQRLLTSASAPRGSSTSSEGNLLRPATLFPLALLFGLAGGWMLLPRGASVAEPVGPRTANSVNDETANSGSNPEAAQLIARQHDLGTAERMAVATEFAASISHDIRNPLAGIQMSLSNLMAESTDAHVVDRLRLLSSETSRIADLLGKAVEAARRTPECSEQINLLEFVDKLLELLRLQTPANFTLECDVDEGLVCRLPPNRFGHCLANLVVNSAQAANGNEGWVRVEMRMRAEFLRIRVLDNGPGFAADIQAGGHRPLITSESDRIGLGLPMARRFVREMGGKLELSNPEIAGSASGSCVTILLPCAGHHG